jgi:anti-sigma factor RsiW
MNCQECGDFLDAYLDNELDAATAIRIRQHLQECRECQEALKSRQALQALLRQEELHFELPPGIRDKVTSSLALPAVKTPSRTAHIVPHFVPLAIAAALALLAGLAWFNLGALFHRATVPLVAEITSNHIRSLLAGHLLDVTSSDQHTVKPWFAGRIQYSPPVKDLSAAGFKLAGARLEYIAHQDVAALVYQYNKHIINLFVWPQTQKGNSPQSTFSRDGYNVVNWEKDGMTFWAVSDVEPSILMKFSEAMQTRS